MKEYQLDPLPDVTGDPVPTPGTPPGQFEN